MLIKESPISDFFIELLETSRRVSGTANKTYEMYLNMPADFLKVIKNVKDPLFFLI